ncbi:xanthine dehydrogenase small subunit [Yimella sp. cx-51]|uniref:xanthine dehydrogenase small subunit n=1 Tax=Yimella sp. cx-51 TaxID=2770551 RepID=UPI001AD899EB|nr:FAD binding domain-containing protein [Yimella sp. cx-51]QTH37775.1 FAD binding domain-containing protein [Yimella sp. cx-51]
MNSEQPEMNLNGRSRSMVDIDPATNALDFIRDCGFTGAKEGCAEGECGACSIMVLRPDGDTSRWVSINACLIPALTLDGQEVVTSEGLGTPTDLHEVQREMAVRGGSQCGYCTPGFICSMAAEFYRPERAPDGEDNADHGANGFDLHSLSGNLCRCTGYRPIRDAAYALGAVQSGDEFASRCSSPAPSGGSTTVERDSRRFVRPATLADALSFLDDQPDAVLVAGSTDWGVDVNLKGVRAPLVIAVDRLEELRTFALSDERLELGAALTLSEIERLLDGRVPLLASLFPQFASRLIRNGATIGGNLGAGSPIGDTPPALLALEATLVLASSEGERDIPLAEYFTGYRETVRKPGELIKSIVIPLPALPITAFHKIAKRRFDDISSVAVGIAVDVQGGIIRKSRIGLGGVAATPIRATATEAALEGKPWSAATITEAAQVLGSEGTPMDDHRASARYRAAMLGTSLEKLFAENDPQEVAS